MSAVFYDSDLDRSTALSNLNLAAYAIVYLTRSVRCVVLISELVILIG